MLELYIIFTIAFVGIFTSVWLILTYLENLSRIVSKIRLKRLPKVSVIIPAYNEEKNISETIESILSSNYPKRKMEVIVVDDGSTDNTYSSARAFKKFGVKVLKKKHGGKASSLNFGLKKASNELVLTIDADTVLIKDSLTNLVKYMKSNKTASVIPNTRVYKPSNVWEKVQDVEYAMSSFIRKILSFAQSLNIANASPIFRKSFFKKYGGFDEKNITEDLEIGLRIQSKNYNLENAFDSIVYTKVPKSFKNLARQRIRWYYGFLYNLSRYKFMFSLKYGDLGFFLLPITLIAFSVSILALFYILSQIAINSFNFFNILSLVGFDVSYFTKLNMTDFLNSIINVQSFVSVALLAVAVIGLLLANGASKVKINFFWYIAYLLFYGWLLTSFEIIGIFYFLRGRKPKW